MWDREGLKCLVRAQKFRAWPGISPYTENT
jgi:hypothetical protein